MVQARKIRYDVIGLTETRRHRPLNATFDTSLEPATVEELMESVSSSHKLGHEHRFIRSTNNPNRTFAVEKMWANTGLDNLRRSNIKLRRRGD
ncbi:hypothetical protein ANCDUO_26312 [Ancylostoma duodenale]|uniref:Uncharacterized protein n=1 Tax=Ancylostoma duodenale TaxID=51022 RepID=A0A0C2C250_9BILA|nr:hypothetical protein ANCDUO_26312 [Ancylostoma duodenale]